VAATAAVGTGVIAAITVMTVAVAEAATGMITAVADTTIAVTIVVIIAGMIRHDRHDYRRGYRHPSYAYRRPPVRHYAPPPRYGSYVTYGYRTGPYFRSGYISPYRIGGYYRPHPRTVYIRDYSRYGLYAPPPGYYWVHDYDRGDAILASVATGAIIGLVVGALAYD
jgi:Ni/Co efflux regulator RcnB